MLGRYGYDYDRRRIFKIGDDGIRRYSYDQLSVITEANEANATVSKYDYGLDQLVGLDNTTEGRSFFHLDILGSTVSLTEAVGSSRQSIFYDAWGNERDRVGVSANKFTFTGHEKDEETGLIYAKARFYDPDVGRFLNQDEFLGDASNPPSLHRYFYANENPLFFVDLDGRQSLAEIARRERARQESAEATVEAGNTEGMGTGMSSFAPDTERREANRSDLRPRTLEEQKAIGVFRPDGTAEKTITEDLEFESTGDPVLDAILKQRIDVRNAIRTIGAVGTEGGKIGLSLAAGTVEDVKVLFTGRDINDEEASRVLSAIGVFTPFVSGSELRVLESVTTQLRKNKETGGTFTEIIVRFTTKGDADEFARQLAKQEKTINRKTNKQIRENIEKLKKSGRPPEANAATRKFRRENPDIGPDDVVLHDLDCCMGGDAVTDVTGIGGRAENSSIGGQNRHRRDAVFEILSQLGDDAEVVFTFIVEGANK